MENTNFINVILLVLASDGSTEYSEFRKIYEKYLDKHPNVKVLFTYGNSAKFEPKSYDLVFPEIEDVPTPGMMLKTLEAFKHINSNYEYDYIVRTNLSTFWDLHGLYERLSKAPAFNYYGGTFRRRHNNLTHQNSDEFVAGLDMILSKDLVGLILENKDIFAKSDLPEDVAFCENLVKLGVEPTRCVPRKIHIFENDISDLSLNSVLNHIKTARSEGKDHFRIKNTSNPKYRHLTDPWISKILLQEYYGEKV